MGTVHLIFLGLQLLMPGCGVKGKPMPPLVPPPIYNEQEQAKEDQKAKPAAKLKSDNNEKQKK